MVGTGKPEGANAASSLAKFTPPGGGARGNGVAGAIVSGVIEQQNTLLKAQVADQLAERDYARQIGLVGVQGEAQKALAEHAHDLSMEQQDAQQAHQQALATQQQQHEAQLEALRLQNEQHMETLRQQGAQLRDQAQQQFEAAQAAQAQAHEASLATQSQAHDLARDAQAQAHQTAQAAQQGDIDRQRLDLQQQHAESLAHTHALSDVLKSMMQAGASPDDVAQAAATYRSASTGQPLPPGLGGPPHVTPLSNVTPDDQIAPPVPLHEGHKYNPFTAASAGITNIHQRNNPTTGAPEHVVQVAHGAPIRAGLHFVHPTTQEVFKIGAKSKDPAAPGFHAKPVSVPSTDPTQLPHVPITLHDGRAAVALHESTISGLGPSWSPKGWNPYTKAQNTHGNWHIFTQ